MYNFRHVVAHSGAGACTKLGVEKSRAALVAAAIGGATLYVDIHSSSAAAPAFVFHTPGAVTEAHAATFPAPYLIEDTTLVGTTFSWAVERGVARAALVECGQHSSRAAIDIAKRTIVRMVTGAHLSEYAPCILAPTGFTTPCHPTQRLGI